MESVATPPGILVPLDGSPLAEQVLPYAQALLAPGAELTLLEVVEEPEADPRHVRPAPRAGRGCAAHARATGPRVSPERAEATLRGERPRVRLEVTRGDRTVEILRVAAEQGVALIAMTTHGRGALGRWVFGSVADRVARSSPVPVLLVRPERR